MSATTPTERLPDPDTSDCEHATELLLRVFPNGPSDALGDHLVEHLCCLPRNMRNSAITAFAEEVRTAYTREGQERLQRDVAAWLQRSTVAGGAREVLTDLSIGIWLHLVLGKAPADGNWLPLLMNAIESASEFVALGADAAIATILGQHTITQPLPADQTKLEKRIAYYETTVSMALTREGLAGRRTFENARALGISDELAAFLATGTATHASTPAFDELALLASSLEQRHVDELTLDQSAFVACLVDERRLVPANAHSVYEDVLCDAFAIVHTRYPQLPLVAYQEQVVHAQTVVANHRKRKLAAMQLLHASQLHLQIEQAPTFE